MHIKEFRAMADRCRELHRAAVRDDIREQLRQWAEDFDAEADALEKASDLAAHRLSAGTGNFGLLPVLKSAAIIGAGSRNTMNAYPAYRRSS